MRVPGEILSLELFRNMKRLDCKLGLCPVRCIFSKIPEFLCLLSVRVLGPAYMKNRKINFCFNLFLGIWMHLFVVTREFAIQYLSNFCSISRCRVLFLLQNLAISIYRLEFVPNYFLLLKSKPKIKNWCSESPSTCDTLCWPTICSRLSSMPG